MHSVKTAEVIVKQATLNGCLYTYFLMAKVMVKFPY